MIPPLCTEMRNLICSALDTSRLLYVLNVGSKDNGDNCPDFKRFFSHTNWKWIGLDLEVGKDVDLVSAPYSYPFADCTFDAVISNQVMEHVELIWLWIEEMARILKPGGYTIISTTWKFKIHRWPVDCWRTLPDGMKAILEYYGMKPCLHYTSDTWTFGVGLKK